MKSLLGGLCFITPMAAPFAASATEPDNDTFSTSLRQTECAGTAGSIGATYTETQTGDFDFASTGVSFSWDKVYGGREVTTKDRDGNIITCKDSSIDIAVEGFAASSNSDFSDGQAANLGLGIKLFNENNLRALTFFIRGGLERFDADDSLIGVYGADVAYIRNFNLIGDTNQLIFSVFARSGYVSSSSIQENTFGQSFENDFFYTSISGAFDWGIRDGHVKNDYHADAYRFRLEMSMEDKINSAEFDVNKIYGLNLSFRRTNNYRDDFRISAGYRWGSDDFEGWLVGISTEF